MMKVPLRTSGDPVEEVYADTGSRSDSLGDIWEWCNGLHQVWVAFDIQVGADEVAGKGRLAGRAEDQSKSRHQFPVRCRFLEPPPRLRGSRA